MDTGLNLKSALDFIKRYECLIKNVNDLKTNIREKINDAEYSSV